MKWRVVSVLLAIVLVVTSIVAPAALADEPAPDAPGVKEARQSPEGRFLQTLQKAKNMRGTVRGQITALSGSEIEVTLGQGDDAQVLVFQVNDETTYRVPEVDEPTLADLEVEMLVAVRPAAEDKDVAKMVGVVNARQMRAINAGQRLLQGVQKLLGNNARRGEVTAIGTDSVTITTPQGDVELILGENTQFIGADGEEIALDDLSVGDAITVVGKPDPTAPINAGIIKIMPEKAE